MGPARRRGARAAARATIGILVVALAACGSNGVKPGTGDGGNGTGDGGGSGTGDGGGQNPWPEAGTNDAPIQACAADSVKAQRLPLDMYIMLDKSGSMDDSVPGGTKWTTVRTALAQFLAQTDLLTGVSVGLQYFPVTSGGDTSCDAADYANPAVPMAELPGVGTAIATSMLAKNPSGNTPTSAALQGAIDYATTWGTAHPDHAVIVILATDGDPTACDPQDIPGISAIAAAGASGTPKVLTFVIGVGSSLTNLNGIAAGGGTTQAFIVDTSGNVGQQFLDALNAIRGAALGCNYRLPSPDGGMPDFDQVNVQYTPGGGGTPETLKHVTSEADCPATGGYWYYDNEANPTQIILCPGVCQTVKADASGTVDVLLGCKTILE